MIILSTEQLHTKYIDRKLITFSQCSKVGIYL